MDDNTNTSMSFGTPIAPQKPKKAKKVLIWILVIIVMLAVGAAAGYYVGQMSRQQEIDNAKQEAAKAEADKNAAKQTPSSSSSDTANSSGDKAPAKTATTTTCNADELSLSVTKGADSGAGTLAYDLVLTNTSKRTCELSGFPGVSLVNDNGNMVGKPAERAENYTKKALVLAPNTKVKTAMSMPNSTNFTDGQCKSGATKFRVYPPNDTGYLSVVSPVDSWCPGFMISPVLSM